MWNTSKVDSPLLTTAPLRRPGEYEHLTTAAKPGRRLMPDFRGKLLLTHPGGPLTPAIRHRAALTQVGILKKPPLRCQSTKLQLSRLVKIFFVVILTAFTGHQTREKHGNWYIIL